MQHMMLGQGRSVDALGPASSAVFGQALVVAEQGQRHLQDLGGV